MPSILNLKFKGNKSFVAFSNLNDTESLTKTWKASSYLEQGQRLENLSWRLWHLQNLMVDTDNAKSKREFKKLSKCMGDKLDKEKGRSIEELEAPDFKRNHSTDLIRQRAVEKERSREASQNAKPGTIKRMQFTFSVDQPAPAAPNFPLKKPDLKPSQSSTSVDDSTSGPAAPADEHDDMNVVEEEANDKDPPRTSQSISSASMASYVHHSLKFDSFFSNDFGPTALLFAQPTLTNSMNYGEGLNPSAANDSFCISRPTIELPLDDILHGMEADSPPTHTAQLSHDQHIDVVMQNAVTPTTAKPDEQQLSSMNDNSSNDSDDEASDSGNIASASSSSSPNLTATTLNAPIISPVNTKKRGRGLAPPLPQAERERDILPETVAPSKVNNLYSTRSSTPTARPTLTVRTQAATPATRSSGPGATATSLNPAVLRSTGGSNSAPGGVKAECSNCGATHTPLWRRGLNDELNCNACGLYCKLHKRPRPKSMRNTHGEGRAQAQPRQETVDVMAQCYNCHTTATPLWRKDDEGKTVCNACGLYYKLHGSARPISMKSDVIRKRSRHDARRGTSGLEDTPSASPGVSRRASPARDASPTLAPDSSTAQVSYDFNSDDMVVQPQSELMNALGPDQNQHHLFQGYHYPGPYHPDYLLQLYNMPSDPLPFTNVESGEELTMSPRGAKRRRMSEDSASEPPSSAVSFSSFTDGYSSNSSATSHSQRSSMDFPFSTSYQNAFNPNGNVLRGSGGSAFWHSQDSNNTEHIYHPPMLPPDESPMDYLHPPMATQDEESLFSTYLHPPMAIPEDNSHMDNSHMFSNNFSGNHDSYDNNMRVY
ncbi:hypothetical protein BDQ17DRAFT_1433165 [Cyathus striatus]|nr:hypothetical protein BDQ17DRAFT_1433165 [Cyathus striatus]